MPLIKTDPLIKLSEVEAALSQVFYPVPDRKTIVAWIEEGTLEGRQFGSGQNWYVYSSSLDEFILASQPRRMAA